MKKTVLNSWHAENGARMVEFAGFEMPIQYDGIKLEHHRIRENIGMFDVSHMGNFFISGKDSAKFINKMIVGNPIKLSKGKVLYSLFTLENGTAVDDLLVYKISDEKFMLVVNASNIEKDLNWLNTNIENLDLKIENKSEDLSIIAIAGPKSFETIEKVFTNIDLKSLDSYSFVKYNYKGNDIYIATTGYTGEIGIEIYCENNITLDIWKQFSDLNVKPSGLASRDTLRLEKGFSLYGHELNETINIIDAGLKWTVDFSTDFIGKNAIDPNLYSPSKKTLGLIINDKGIPREGAEIFYENKKVGIVTSGTMSPTLNKGIALVMVDSFLKSRDNVEVILRGKKIAATLCKRKMA